MPRTVPLPAVLLLSLLWLAPAAAQGPDAGFQQEFMAQFQSSAGKLVSLAEAMPADAYTWRPAEGVASVAEALLHIARYNYYYPETGLGVARPAGVALEGMEQSTTSKAEVVERLRHSLRHVAETVQRMPEEEMTAMTRLYGRDVTRRAVLLQLITHMNEHLGQSIAYARSNGVVPPWSR